MGRIFLSHSSRNDPVAIALRQWLIEQRPGLEDEIFLDRDSDSGIRSGERWKDALIRAGSRCEVVVCLVSRAWLESRECAVEFRTAENLGKRIMIARLEVVDGDITRDWQRCDLFGDGPTTTVRIGESPEPVTLATVGLRRLLAGLDSAGIAADYFPWPPPEDPERSPYRGWQPFNAIDAAVYFGRDGQILRAMDCLRGMRTSGPQSMFTILGPSGTGKSSFLRAGLLPRLAREDHDFVVLDVVRPERQPLTGPHGFAASLHAARARFGLTTPALGDIKVGITDPDRIRLWLRQLQESALSRTLRPSGAQLPTVVLPLDQAEEMFAVDAGAQGRRLLELLGGLLIRTTDRAELLVATTIRTDRYQLLQTAPELAETSSIVFDDLKPLPRTRFEDIITGPAARSSAAGHRLGIHPDLLDRLLSDCIDGADTLPLLALTLARLHQNYGDTGVLSLAHYETVGGLAGVVASEIDTLLSADPDQRRDELATLRPAFVPWLATLDPNDDQPLRRIARWDDLPAESHVLLDRFVDRRLLVKDHRNGETTVEVALESLLRQWDDLAGWLGEEGDDLRDAVRLEQAAVDWDRNNRDGDWLLTGSRLTELEALASRGGYRDRLASCWEFLAASRQRADEIAETAEQRHADELAAVAAHAAALRTRSRILALLVVVALVIASTAAVFYRNAQSEQRRAAEQARQALGLHLTSEGEAILSGRQAGGDIRAFQEILSGRALAPGPKTDGAIINALNARPALVSERTIALPSQSMPLAFSPDGRRAVVDDIADGVTGAAVWDSADGSKGTVFQYSGALVALSWDGTRAVVDGQDLGWQLWDTRAGWIAAPLPTNPGETFDAAAFSPDRKWIAVHAKNCPNGSAQCQGNIHLFNATTGRADRVLPGVDCAREFTEVEVAFTPDSQHLLLHGCVAGLDSAIAGVEQFQLFDVTTGEALAIRMDLPESTGFFAPHYRGLGASADGKYVALGRDDGTILLAPTCPSCGTTKLLHGLQEGAATVVFNSDGSQLTAVDGAGHEVVWQVSAALSTEEVAGFDHRHDWTVQIGRPVGLALAGTAQATNYSLSCGGEQLIGALNHIDPDGSSSRSAIDGVRVWQLATGTAKDLPVGPTDSVVGTALSCDGSAAAVERRDGSVTVWKGESAVTIQTPKTTLTQSCCDWALALDAHGEIVATSNTDGVHVWDLKTRKTVGQRIGTSDVTALAISIDGSSVATGSWDGTVQIWDTASGRPRGKSLLAGQHGTSNRVLGLAFSPDGQRIVTSVQGGYLQLWDIAIGQTIGDPAIARTVSGSVVFDSTGRQVFVASDDMMTPEHPVHSWPIYTAADLCSNLTANMSRAEWRDLVAPSDVGYVRPCPTLAIAPDR